MPRDLTTAQHRDEVAHITEMVEAHGSYLAYDRDGIQLWCGDNAQVRPQEHVDLVLTDPPYGIGAQALTKNFTPHAGDKVAGDDEPFDPTWMLERYPRLVLWGANYYADRLPMGGWLAWDKRVANQRDNGMSEAELAWTNCFGRVMMYRHRWHGNVRDSELGLWLHPTQKPAALMAWVIERLTQPGDLIYDPYMGSGPVAEACLSTGRRYLGVELEPRYVAISAERMGRTTPTLF